MDKLHTSGVNVSNFGVANSNTLIPNLNNAVFQNTINNIKEV